MRVVQEDYCDLAAVAGFALGLVVGVVAATVYHQIHRPPTPQERVQEIAERSLEELNRLRREVLKRLDDLRKR